MKILNFLLALLLLIAATIQVHADWTENYEKALVTAKDGKKMVLLDFTGSDWCPWCIKLDKDVYDTKTFTDYAEKNLVLVKVDFPQSKPQADEIKKQNDKLQSQYAVDGFPTAVLLNSDGKKLGQIVGYVEGGPTAYLKQLDDLAKGNPSAPSAQ